MQIEEHGKGNEKVSEVCENRLLILEYGVAVCVYNIYIYIHTYIYWGLRKKSLGVRHRMWQLTYLQSCFLHGFSQD